MIGRRSGPKYQSIKGVLDRVDASEAADTLCPVATPIPPPSADSPPLGAPQRTAPPPATLMSPKLLVGSGLALAVASGGLLAMLVGSAGDRTAARATAAADASRTTGSHASVADNPAGSQRFGDVDRFAASATALSGFKILAKTEPERGVPAAAPATSPASPAREPARSPAESAAAETSPPPSAAPSSTEPPDPSATTVKLSAAAPVGPGQTTSVPQPPKPPRIAQAPPANPPSISPERMAALIAKGHAFADAGDIAGARAMFERAADGGSAEAAQMMAETYDPAVLKRRGVIGLVGDSERARLWYERAATLREQQSAGGPTNAR